MEDIVQKRVERVGGKEERVREGRRDVSKLENWVFGVDRRRRGRPFSREDKTFREGVDRVVESFMSFQNV